MKRLIALLVIATIAIALPSMAQEVHFDGDAGAGDPSWNTALNWSDNAVPTAAKYVKALSFVGYGAVVNGSADCLACDVGTWDHPGELTVASGGSLTTVGDFLIANNAGLPGALNNAGTIDVGSVLYFRDGIGSFENSGTFTANGIVMGDSTTAASTLVNTGTMTVNGWIHLSVTASNTPSVFTMAGGTVTADRIEMAQAGRGHLNLNGGTMTLLDTIGLNGNGGYTIDVTGGTLVVGGDHTSGMDWMIGSSLITAYGGASGTGPVAVYDGGLDQTTLSATGTPTVITWQGNVDDLWSTGANWNSGTIPVASKNVSLVNAGTYTPRVDAAGAVASNLIFGASGVDADLTIDASGTLSVGAAAYFRDGKNTMVNDGTFTSDGIVMGEFATAESELTNTGTMNINGWLHLSVNASNAPSILNMNAGTITADNLEMHSTGSGHLNLHGGTMTLGAIGLNGDGGYTIDVTEGVLIAGGNHTNGMEWMISTGLITAYGGFPELLEVAYDAGQDETTLSASVPVFTGLDSVFAGDTAIDDLWTTAANWTLGVPYAELQGSIVNPIFGTYSACRIDAAGASAWTVYLGKWGHPGKLEIESAGTLSIWNHLILGDVSTATGTVVNAGSIDALAGIHMRGAKATLENSGTISTYTIVLGDEVDMASTFINTGDVTVEGWMYLSHVASNTPSVFNMNGGTVDIGGMLAMPTTGAAGRLNLNGGIITCGSIGLVDSDAYIIDVGAGVLIVDGDFAPPMNYLIGKDYITAYNGYAGAVVTAVYDAGTDTTTLSATGGPLADYDEWDALWTEDLSDREADYESDGLINLLEYAYGGDPLVDDAAAFSPTIEVVTNVMTHVYNRRIQAYNTGELSFDVEVTANLVTGPWYEPSLLGGTETVGTTADPNIASVTNSIPVTGIDAGFVNLEVTEN